MKKKLKVKTIDKEQNRLAAFCFFVAGGFFIFLALVDFPCVIIGFICFGLALLNLIISVI